MRMLPKLYDGTHLEHPLAARRAVRHVEFNVPVPVDVMIDGEIVSQTLQCRSLDIIPAAGWTSIYEARPWLVLRSVFLWVLSILHFFVAAPTLVLLAIFLDPREETRPATACVLPPHRLSLRRSRRGSAFGWLRSPSHLLLYGQSRQSLRPFPSLLRNTAVCTRQGAGIPLPDSRLSGWLMKALRQRPGARCAPSVRLETHVALDARRRQRWHQPDHLSRSHGVRWRGHLSPVPGRRLPRGPAAWCPHCPGKPGGLVPTSPHWSLDALARHRHGSPARHCGNQGPHQRGCPRPSRQSSRNNVEAPRSKLDSRASNRIKDR